MNYMAIKNSKQPQLRILVTLTIVLVSAQLINTITGYWLNQHWGLLPRYISGLPGIVTSPFLHGNWVHLFANLPVLLVLSALVMWDSTQRYLKVSLFIILGSGLLVWMLGRTAIHIGASGWIFGLWAWLMMRAFYQRNFRNIAIAIGLALFYGSAFLWGLLPKEGVSFEGHLAGLVCGGVAAYWMYRK